VATGTVTAACKPRHRHNEFLAFLKQIDRAYPGRRTWTLRRHRASNPHARYKQALRPSDAELTSA
jgi:hypothetical protein